MTTVASTTAGRTRRPVRRRRAVRQFVPPQHGAWAMLLLPWLASVTVTGFSWPHLPLLGAWLAGYLLSYYALQAVKTRRPSRFRSQLLLYGAATAPLALLVVAVRPQVLWFAPAYAVLLAVNVAYAWRRRERTLANDIASVVQSCLIVFVAAAIADVPIRSMVEVFFAVLAYFTGTVLYVKTMIRERDNVAYRRASIAYHVLALGAAAWLSLPLAAVFALLLARAWALPGRRLSPKHVGLLEIANCVLLYAIIVVGYGG
jgi:hypothetical protein